MNLCALCVSVVNISMTEPIQEISIRRYRPEGMDEVTDRVAVEEPLEIRLAGGEPFQVLMRLPGMEKELAVGFLYTEGIIRNLADIITLHFCGTATDPLLPPNVVDIVLSDAAQARTGRRHLEVAYSSCSLCAKEALAEICRKMDQVRSDLTIDRPTLLALMERMAASQDVFRKTGGTHGVALATPDGQVFLLAEDIGRHNAMDKVIGRALMQRLDMTRMVALLSGRISFEMALKTARAGIPILAAVSAPTSMALTLARELRLTLAGFARRDRMNVYTHPERIV